MSFSPEVQNPDGAHVVLEGLRKKFGAYDAVSALSLSIKKGELLSLLGPSGCGKTTVLRMVAGLVPPTSGAITIAARAMTEVPANKRNIGMLFQQYALFPHMTVQNNIAFGLRMRRIPQPERKRAVERALALVKLSELADRYPLQLSGGQQQRVALARALVVEPSVLLLDEPFGALDKNLRESMQLELRELQRGLGITTIMVTHDQEEALILSDRVAIMNAGRLEQVGSARQVYVEPASVFVANFMGASNIVAAQVMATDSAHTVLDLAGSRLEIPTPSERPRAGNILRLLLRPEHIKFRSSTELNEPEREPHGVDATLTKTIFRGPDTHLTFSLRDGTELKIASVNRDPSAAVPETGETYRLSWPASAMRPLA